MCVRGSRTRPLDPRGRGPPLGGPDVRGVPRVPRREPGRGADPADRHLSPRLPARRGAIGRSPPSCRSGGWPRTTAAPSSSRSCRPRAAADPVAQLILDKAEGNPFFLEELTRAVRDQGLGADLPVPDTVHGVLTARIDRLDEEPKRVLQTASVLGREFAPRLLAAIWDGPGAVEPHLRELARLEFLFERTTGEDVVYVFKHALTQDVAEATLLPSRRRELHRRAGEALERLHPERLAELAPRLAHHYGEAEAWAPAADHAHRAAEAARAVFANREALARYDQAIAAAQRGELPAATRLRPPRGPRGRPRGPRGLRASPRRLRGGARPGEGAAEPARRGADPRRPGRPVGRPQGLRAGPVPESRGGRGRRAGGRHARCAARLRRGAPARRAHGAEPGAHDGQPARADPRPRPLPGGRGRGRRRARPRRARHGAHARRRPRRVRRARSGGPPPPGRGGRPADRGLLPRRTWPWPSSTAAGAPRASPAFCGRWTPRARSAPGRRRRMPTPPRASWSSRTATGAAPSPRARPALAIARELGPSGVDGRGALGPRARPPELRRRRRGARAPRGDAGDRARASHDAVDRRRAERARTGPRRRGRDRRRRPPPRRGDRDRPRGRAVQPCGPASP